MNFGIISDGIAQNLKHAKPVTLRKRAQRPELARADLGAAMPDVIAREVGPAQGRLLLQ